MSRSAVEAMRRKFTPEFVNRLGHVVVFKPLGNAELQRILELELDLVQQRLLNGSSNAAVAFTVSAAGKRFLLDEGTDARYGARHLKRAIERLVVQPMSRLVGSNQVRHGDQILIDHRRGSLSMAFFRESALPVWRHRQVAS